MHIHTLSFAAIMLVIVCFLPWMVAYAWVHGCMCNPTSLSLTPWTRSMGSLHTDRLGMWYAASVLCVDPLWELRCRKVTIKLRKSYGLIVHCQHNDLELKLAGIHLFHSAIYPIYNILLQDVRILVFFSFNCEHICALLEFSSLLQFALWLKLARTPGYVV